MTSDEIPIKWVWYRPMLQPWRTFLSTGGIIFVFDSGLLLAVKYLQPNWFLAVPVFAVNLPALPLALLYSVMLDDSISKSVEPWLYASEAMVSSLFWGYVAFKASKRKLHDGKHVGADQL